MKKRFRLRNIIILLFLGYFSYVFVSTTITMLGIQKEISVKKQELAKAKDKNTQLKDEYQLSKTDAYIEKLAREMGLIKQGETPVINNK